ncbi:hypothetical protein ACFXTO_029080 [Malus domestica]
MVLNGCRQLGGIRGAAWLAVVSSVGGGGGLYTGILGAAWLAVVGSGGGGVYTLTKIHGAACLSSARVVGTNRVQGPLSNIP